MSSLSSSLPRVLAISGSLRSGSFHTAILQGLADALASEAAVEVFDLASVPLYNQDIDTAEPPAGVAALRAAAKAADLIVLASPEYNYSMPGVLKNALDWASRPYGQSCFIGKPVLIITASPAFTGGARAQANVRETVFAIGGLPVSGPELVLPAIHEKLVNGKLPPEALSFCLKAVQAALAA